MTEFVEIPGTILFKLVDADELPQLKAAGVDVDTKIRVNRQGDIEMLRGAIGA